MKVTAYIPCHNNAAGLENAIRSLRSQTDPIEEILVIDDGSHDGSALVAEQLGARVIRHPVCLGRGAARARAFIEARGELVLGLDASCTIETDFLARSRRWLTDLQIAGVFARIVGPVPSTTVERWRARHLFQESCCVGQLAPNLQASLVTTCSLLRRDVVVGSGNFDARRIHSEDADLGQRLLASGWLVVADPTLTVHARKHDTLASVLERYWRWHVGTTPKTSLSSWARMLCYAVKIMAARDLKDRDPFAAAISLWVPHDQLWRTWREQRKLSLTI